MTGYADEGSSSDEVEHGPRGRDPTSIESLLKDYGGWLRRTLTRLCPRDLPIDVDDVYQEVSIKLWRILDSEKDIEHVPSYLYRVASTATIDAIRKVRARATAELADDDAQPMEIYSVETSPERLVTEAQLDDVVRELVSGLGENRRVAVALHLQGFELAQIARLLGWPEPKTRNLVYRGLSDLRAGLKEKGIGH